MPRTVNLRDDENLADEVMKYPCIYDRADTGHREKDRVMNAWKEVDNSLNLPEGEAKRRFENLKKRFSKKKRAMKDAARSGSGSQEASTAERGLKEYEFLSWLQPFLRLKTTDENLSMLHIPDSEWNGKVEDFDNSSFDSDEEDSTFVDDIDRSAISNTSHSYIGMKVIPNQSRPKQPSRNAQLQEDTALERIVKVLEAPSKQDADDIFGLMVSNEIKGIPERQKRKLKNEINNLIFRYQEENDHENPPPRKQTLLSTVHLAQIS